MSFSKCVRGTQYSQKGASQDQKLLEFVLPPVARDVQHIHMPYNGTGKAKLEEIQQDLDSLTRKFRTISVSSPHKKDPAFDIGSPQFHYGANTSRPRADASREWLSDKEPDDPPLVPPSKSPLRATGRVDTKFKIAGPSLSPTSSSAARPLSPTASSSPLSSHSRVPGSYRIRSNTSTTNDSYMQPPPYEQRTVAPPVDSISHDLDQIEMASDLNKTGKGSASEASSTTITLPSMAATPLTPTSEDPFHQIRMLGRNSPVEPWSCESSNIDQHKLWRATLFKHTVILFDKKCSAVEFTKPNERRFGDFLMEPASGPCQLYLITKGNKSTTGDAKKYSTSIWVLSDDGEVVMEQQLPDDSEVIPYTIWDNHTKIVLRVPAELKFFRKTPSDRPREKATTTWINYVFADEPSMYPYWSLITCANVFSGYGIPKCFDGEETTCIHSNQKDNSITQWYIWSFCKSATTLCSRESPNPSRPQFRSSLCDDSFCSAVLYGKWIHDIRSQ